MKKLLAFCEENGYLFLAGNFIGFLGMTYFSLDNDFLPFFISSAMVMLSSLALFLFVKSSRHKYRFLTTQIFALRNGDEVDFQHLHKDVADDVEFMKKELDAIMELLKNMLTEGFDKQDVLENKQMTLSEKIKELTLLYEKEKFENKDKEWVASHLNEFSNLVLDGLDEENFEDALMRKICKTLDLNQGAFYLVKEDHIECKSVYAYGKKKWINTVYGLSEGLLGQCYLEAEPIFMTDVPDDYVNITSGLGEALPRCIVIMPCLHRGKVIALMEFASFRILDNAQMLFLKRLSDQIGGSLAYTKQNLKNRLLLRESQESHEKLKAQEEELRQSYEEVTATHEEILSQKLEIQSISNELTARMKLLDKVMLITESDLYGNITYANQRFLEVTGYQKEECIGKPHNILRHPSNPKSLFEKMWKTIKSGKVFTGQFPNKKKNGETYWVDAMIAPVFDAEDRIIKYINVRYDITEKVKLKDLINNHETL
ncbi:PAS domain-containing protein [Aureibacter tunicatorum]|uniref:Methyl-accepting chemotaxis protein n=1 Tax=Aureibacter tunicatorum TaxID=866807 RepID=A0AAE3XRZ4_9BACT|nr:PAS domain-containing protein [Aureibacter tunicatorum]MDR6241475.1 methyl-accepting chemotaxis protein [Aureibacter tunicatorum]BDD06682.1 hypothetical protein AUTU_41650 [Aureibacter tunicatorum]